MILRLLTGMGLLSLSQALGQAEPVDDLRVLEGDQRQVLWNVLINQSRQLDQQRAKRLDRALEQLPQTEDTMDSSTFQTL